MEFTSLRRAAAASAAALVAGLITTAPAQAAPDGSAIVISEAYVNGSAANAAFTNRFIELHNPTDVTVSLSGLSVQYRSAAGTGASNNTIALTGSIAAGGNYLIQGSANSGPAGDPLPTPDVSGAFNSAGASGTVALVSGTSAITLPTGSVAGNPQVLDLVGYGTSNTFEGAAATGQGAALSLNRVDAKDTNSNTADFKALAPTPCNTTECAGGEEPPGDPVAAMIEEIQGSGDASPLAGKLVTTKGVVTATYPTGGFNGVYLQTAGSGGSAGTNSSGIFVFDSAIAAAAQVGDAFTVTGKVSEFNGLTEIAADSFQPIAEPQEAVKATPTAFPLSEAKRESLEGMLIEPEGTFTITNNYATNQYAEIGLAAGDSPLRQPTNEVRPGTPEYDQLVTDNAAKLVTLDDGSSVNFFGAANQGTPLPWLTPANEVRAGATTHFTGPAVLDFRFGWKLQPQGQQTADNAAERQVVADFTSTREAAPKDVGGDIRLASFNVLNYFTTLGEDYAAIPGNSCTYFKDRTGANVTTNNCGATGPRGAANAASFERQQAKIVTAMNDLTADVVSLEEIENSIHYGTNRDEALSRLVTALNAKAGAGTWDYVRSPVQVPTSEDVIRTAFIYKTKNVKPVGDSEILLDSPAFSNARQPLAQGFAPVNGTADDTFIAIVNHFKSKGSGSGADADQGDGQGASNHSRVLQSEALVSFAEAQKARVKTDKVFLLGDFNAYTKEDPLVVLADAGYVDIGQTMSDKETYQFDGRIGSLDHVFASPTAARTVTGADVWNINSYESVAREYSRHNYNVLDFYNTGAFRSSDHDPIVVGVKKSGPALVATKTQAYSTFLGIWVAVTAGSKFPDGTATLYDGDRKLATTKLIRGLAYFSPRLYSPRANELRVAYSGSTTFATSEGKVQRLW